MSTEASVVYSPSTRSLTPLPLFSGRFILSISYFLGLLFSCVSILPVLICSISRRGKGREGKNKGTVSKSVQKVFRSSKEDTKKSGSAKNPLFLSTLSV